MIKVNKPLLIECVNKGLVKKNLHLTEPLRLYDYTKDCMFKQTWNEITIMTRGLVLDHSYNVVAKGFNKFFNLEELENKKVKIPWSEKYTVTEKMDGSMLMYFAFTNPYSNVTTWHTNTRGSFYSTQAIMGKTIIDQKYKHVKFNKDYTYIFEVIYPDNRLVVNYGNMTDVVLIGVINIHTGKELDLDLFKDSGLNIVPHYTEHIFELIKNPIPNKEGYVVTFESGFKFKVKFEEYVTLHKLWSGLSSKALWECVSIGMSLEDIKYHYKHKEFFDFIDIEVEALNDKFNEHISEINKAYKHVKNFKNRKTQAKWVNDNVQKCLRGFVFSKLDNKFNSLDVYKVIQPNKNKKAMKGMEQ